MNLDFSIILAQWPRFLWGLGYDLYFALAGFAIGCVIGFISYLCSTSNVKIVKALSYTYVQIVRGLPMYLLLLWIYFGLATKFGLALTGPQSIIIAIAIMSSAFTSEIFRTGYNSIDVGQLEAGKALGLSDYRINRTILFPQVIRVVIPPLLNVFVICFKASTYAAVVAVPELIFAAQDISLNQYRPFEAYITVAALLIATMLVLSMMVKVIETRLNESKGV
ncbi:His/Glu/Gln/Arg/opine family amino acid ABC transporter permease subunit [Neorhizobium galegae]|uniref:amino acid ABC transporter permease n=1 Tax=Neorhizobium galegae TaxID=399 RepID=UPI00277E8894|nr:amino acid ABC transporter permease [Neorhizobium galegae]MDQ0138391.1 His/Glu/Gln/Arg/opine family amino acid ABC transporter permease subunit [Neorhizobium galegae]